MNRHVKIADIKTPARLYAVTETETAYGGRTFTLEAGAVVWGDFRPDMPVLESGEGDVGVVQEADFLCRSAAGLARGGRLSLKGFDWTIISVDEDADGVVRVRIGRVHP